MNWRDVFLDNLGFKVAALVVVMLLWVSVTADERQAQPVETALSIEVQDTSWVLVESPEEVYTTFQGTNRDLLGLLLEKPVVSVKVDSVTGERMRIPLPVDRVQYNRERGVAPTFINPAAVDLRFERRRSVRLPVVADVEAIAAPGYIVLQPIEVEPESVTVHGPAKWIEAQTRVSTRSTRLEDLTNTVMRDIPLDLPSTVRGVRAEPPAVLVTVTLDSLIVRQLRLPIRATGAAAASVRIRPDSVTVDVRGVAEAVGELAGALEAVEIPVPEPPGGPRQVQLSVEVDVSGPVAVSLDPATATVEPRT